MTMMAMDGDETDTDSSPETSMGSLLGRASACEVGWKSVVSKLLYQNLARYTCLAVSWRSRKIKEI